MGKAYDGYDKDRDNPFQPKLPKGSSVSDNVARYAGSVKGDSSIKGGVTYDPSTGSVTTTIPYQFYPDNTRLGWKCPVCGKGNAPSVTQCPCVPPYYNGPIWYNTPPYTQPVITC